MHLFRCAHDEERMDMHDVMWDVFVAIVRDVGFHVSQK